MLLIDLSQFIQNVKSAKYIVIDQAIVELYPAIAKTILDKHVFYLDDPEFQKSLQTYEIALEFFLEAGISRDDDLVAVGGGATSDFAGFVASTLLRGINWSVYPTTLLAMVDAAIGGKVGINSKIGKNLIGNFHEPVETYICHEFLTTLPSEEYISGQGEIIKYAFLSEKINDLLTNKVEIDLIIKECVKFKEKIVEEDFKESGKRKILNLGHTFGHAIEKVSGIPHGVAVIIGLKMIIDLYASNLEQDFVKILKQFDFSFDIPKISFLDFEKQLKLDKKSKKDGTIDLIIPVKIGEVKIHNDKIECVIKTLKEYSLYNTFFI